MPEERNPYIRQVQSAGRSSFSGADIDVYGLVSGDNVNSSLFKMDSVQVITISSFREKVPVKGLGNANVLSYVSGPRNYAGSLITTVIERHPLYDFISTGIEARPENDYSFSYDDRKIRVSGQPKYNPDQLPPLTIMLRFKNELGNRASIFIFGVEFLHNGITMAIDDMITENTYQFVARDAFVLIDPTQVIGAGFEWFEFQTIDNPSIWQSPDQIAQAGAILYEQKAGHDWDGYLPSTAPPKNTNNLPIPQASTSVNSTSIYNPLQKETKGGWAGFRPST